MDANRSNTSVCSRFRDLIESIRSLRWDQKVFLVLFCLALLLNGAVVWSVPYLPMGDLGGHVEMMDVFARYSDPTAVYSDVYLLPNTIAPNTLGLYLAWIASPLLGSYAVAKLLVTFYVLGLPLGVVLLCRAFGRSPWLSFFSFFIAFGALFNVGYLNFIVSIPLLLFAAAATVAFMRKDRWNWPMAVVIGLLLALCFLSHVLGYLIAVGISVFLVLVYASGARSLSRVAVVAPSFMLFFPWFYRKFIIIERTEAGRAYLNSDGGGGAVYKTYGQLFEQMHTWGMQFFRDDSDEIALVVCLVTWFLLLVGSGNSRKRGEYEGWVRLVQSIIREHAVECLAICSFLAYFLIPSHAYGVATITERIILLVLLFGSIVPRFKLFSAGHRWRASQLLLVPIVSVTLVYPLNVWKHFSDFNEQLVGGLPKAIGALENGSSLCYVMLRRTNDLTHQGPLWHLPKLLHSTKNGGMTNDSWAKEAHSYVQYQPGKLPPPIGGQYLSDPRLLAYDYLLLRADAEPRPALRSERLKLRFHEGVWWLFDIVQRKDAAERPSAGGVGGVPFSWRCPKDSYIIGGDVALRAGSIGGFRPLCSGAVTPEVWYGAKTGADRRQRDVCQPGESVVGMHGSHQNVISQLGIECEPGGGQASRKIPAHGKRSGTAFDLSCPAGGRAVGIHGLSGDLVDRIGLICSAGGTQ